MEAMARGGRARVRQGRSGGYGPGARVPVDLVVLDNPASNGFGTAERMNQAAATCRGEEAVWSAAGLDPVDRGHHVDPICSWVGSGDVVSPASAGYV